VLQLTLEMKVYANLEFNTSQILPLYFLTNSMEQSPSETNIHTASQEIPLLSWNLNVHYYVHQTPLMHPILSHLNPV